MKNTLVAISLLGILATVAVSQTSFAQAASCSGDCTPPTLGLTDNGRRVVENGLVINDVPFNVESGSSQTIPTQVFEVGDQVTIKITGYENSGIGNMRHISVAISDYNKKPQYQDKVKMSIDQTFDGVVGRSISDPSGLINRVNMKTERLDSFTGTLTISFVAAKPFDTSSITIQMWDAALSTSKYIFTDAIQVVKKQPVVEDTTASTEPATDTTPAAEKTVNPYEAKVKKKGEDQQRLKDEKIKAALESTKNPYISKGQKKYQLPQHK